MSMPGKTIVLIWGLTQVTHLCGCAGDIDAGGDVSSASSDAIRKCGRWRTCDAGTVDAASMVDGALAVDAATAADAATVDGAGALSCTHYVSPIGSDVAGCGSATSPWLTLSHACNSVRQRGSVICLAAGQYIDNDPCTLALGVGIQGAGTASTSINATASPYINATSTLPVVDGSNVIRGIRFVGNGSNSAIYSEGRSNQTINGCSFETLGTAIEVHGKMTRWSNTCITTPPTQSATYCDDDETLTIEPASTDWATGIEISDNTLTNSKMMVETIMGARIHDNTIENSTSLKSAVGNTALWWNGVSFHNNTLRMQTIAWSTIALEVWMVEGDSRFYDNQTNGWFSILKNPTGPNLPYSWEILNNTFASDVPPGVGSVAVGAALETCYHVQNVLIAGNYFVNTGSANTYQQAIGIHGKGQSANFIIRNNIIYRMNSDGVEINSWDTSGALFVGNNINIYNNVFEDMNNGSSQGVYITDGPGTISDVRIKNNLFMNVSHGALIWPSTSDVTGVEFTFNVVSGGGYTYDYGTGGFSVVTSNYNFAPQIQASGSRPDPYYRAASATANIVDIGVNVGLPFNGAAPDIGAYEF